MKMKIFRGNIIANIETEFDNFMLNKTYVDSKIAIEGAFVTLLVIYEDMDETKNK